MIEKTPKVKKQIFKKPKENIVVTPRGDIIPSEPKVKAVDTGSTPNPEKPEELVEILIDKEMTSGGIRVNGKLYVGYVKVPRGQADDLLRIQEEYWETMKKLIDPRVRVRMKNDFQKELLFLADPAENEMKKEFSRDYGLLGRREWELCTETFKQYLLDMRKQIHGY